MPLRIASGTSFALPSPKPTRPLPSPTTTKALKLNRRPPFTTLATRLMWTTFSFSSTPGAGRVSAGAPAPPPSRSSASACPSRRRLARLARLAANRFLCVLDTLALVGLGRPELADGRHRVPEELAVGALEGHHHLPVHLGGDPRRELEGDGMGVAERQEEHVAAGLRAVADPVDLEHPGEALGDPVHHVADELPRETVDAASAARVVAPPDDDHPAFDRRAHLGIDAALERPLGALDAHDAVGGVDADALRQREGLFADARHLLSLPDRAEYFATDVLAPGVAVDQEPLGGREHAHPEAAEHGRDLLGPHVDAEARPADALEAADHRPPLGVIAQLDAEDRPRARLDDRRAGEVSLGGQHLGEGLLLPRPRHVDGGLARAGGVADAREEVGDRVGQHGRVTSSPSPGPESARGAPGPADRAGTCGSGGRTPAGGRTAGSGCRRAP